MDELTEKMENVSVLSEPQKQYAKLLEVHEKLCNIDYTNEVEIQELYNVVTTLINLYSTEISWDLSIYKNEKMRNHMETCGVLMSKLLVLLKEPVLDEHKYAIFGMADQLFFLMLQVVHIGANIEQ